jgi:hypothetical protein
MMLLPHTVRRRRRRRPRSWWQTESSWGCEWGYFLDGSFCFLKEMVYTRLTDWQPAAIYSAHTHGMLDFFLMNLEELLCAEGSIVSLASFFHIWW